jgi:hypothetical protein
VRYVLAFVVAIAGCASPASVRGRAEVASSGGVSVLTMCDSHRRYQLGVSTSNAAMQRNEVDAMVAKGSPVLVDVSGFESTLPSGWERAPGAGVISVGYIRPVGRGSCP